MSGLDKNANVVAKTIKLFMGGEFPRTESGRSFPVYFYKTKNVYANLCLASRKDLRNAVTHAQGAQHGWATRSAYNRSQILYRMAEMLEAKRAEVCEVLTATLGYTLVKANKSVDEAVDAFVYYAGFCDKYQQLIGSVNPVSGPHHNFTTPEAVGVVALVADRKFDFAKLVAQIAAVLTSGNSLVVVMAQEGAAVIAPLSEVFATSDLPKGVVNLLTGDIKELQKYLGEHMEIQSISCQDRNAQLLGDLRQMAALNMKRVVGPVDAPLSLEHILQFVEYKTVWHPVGY